MKSVHFNVAIGALALEFTAFSPAARADVYDLTVDHCSGSGCGTAPFGSVTVVEDSSLSNTLDFTVTLFNGNTFVKSGASTALAFNLSPLNPAPTLTSSDFSDITAGFDVGKLTTDDSIHLDGTGYFDYEVVCTVCANGASNPQTGPLSFKLTLSSGLNLSDLVANAAGNFFTVDILSAATGQTGPVAANGLAPVTPEPGAAVLYGSGLILFGGWLRRRNRKSAANA